MLAMLYKRGVAGNNHENLIWYSIKLIFILNSYYLCDWDLYYDSSWKKYCIVTSYHLPCMRVEKFSATEILPQILMFFFMMYLSDFKTIHDEIHLLPIFFFFWQFSMWTDAQRKKFLTFILKRCTKSQLRFVNEGWFKKQLPILHLDFTTVLPQFISTYIFSFLDPRSLCRAAQVSWHWKFVCEQDVIWMPKCLRYGWYLPYTPSSREFGCWKHHYIMCTSSLDMEAPSRMVSFFLIWYVTNNWYVRQCAWHIYAHLYIHCRPLKVCSFHFRRQRIMVNLLTTALELLKERSNKKQMKRGRTEKQSITEKVYRDINCNLTL